MPLLLAHRRAGDVTIITCSGRLIEGAETTALDGAIDEVLPYTPYVVLHLAAVDFVDSSGLGLLVRLLHRTRRAGGNLTLCAAPARVAEALRLTRLTEIFDLRPDESAAIAACYERARDAGTPFGAPDVLCVHPSADVLSYLRELLGRSGYLLISATNVPDALTLLRAARPKMVVIAHALRATETSAGQAFNALADRLGVIILPDGFARLEAGEAAESLLAKIAAVVPPGAAGSL